MSHKTYEKIGQIAMNHAPAVAVGHALAAFLLDLIEADVLTFVIISFPGR